MTQNQLTVNKDLIQPIPFGAPTVEIAKSMGFTVNLQAYESARIDVSVKITGTLENIEAIKAEVTKQLEGEVKEAIGQLVEQHDTRKTLLGYNK